MSSRAPQFSLVLRRVVACALLGLVLCAFAAQRIANDAYLELRSQREPDGWRAWPVLPSYGGYTLSYDETSCVGHGLQCAWSNVVLSENNGALPRGVSLDAAYSRLGIYAMPPVVRGSGNLRVVSVGPVYAGQEDFAAAFSTDERPRSLSFHHPTNGGTVVVVGAVLALLFVSAIACARYLAASRAFNDRTRFRAGIRDATNTISFDDGTPPIVLDASLHAAPGPVLVRVATVEMGSYRASPTTRTAEVLDGDPTTIAYARAAHVAGVLRAVFFGALVAFGLALVITGLDACSRVRWMD